MSKKDTTILIADDDERVVKVLMLRLGKLGFNIVTASDGYSALALASECKPNLLLLDINMPAGDGFSVQERMKGISAPGGVIQIIPEFIREITFQALRLSTAIHAGNCPYSRQGTLTRPSLKGSYGV